MAKYIGLTALTSHWGSHNNTLLLTDGCRVRGAAEPWRNFDNPVDMERFHGAGAVVAAQEFCNQYALAYMPILADALEAHLKLGYGQRFYQRIIAPWLVWFVQAAYDRYCSICKAASLHGVCFITSEGKLRPRSSASTHNDDAATNDIYNLFLYSDIVRALDLPEESRPVIDTTSVGSYQFGDPTAKTFAKEAARCCLLGLEKFFSDATHLCYDVYGMPILRNLLSHQRGLLPMSHSIQVSLDLDEQFRASPLQLAFHDDFSRILSFLIPRYLPVGLCEAIPYFVKWAKLQKFPKHGVIATSVGLYTDPAVMVLAGVLHRPLAILEHGGNGMLCQSDPHLFAQEITADRYYSMGQGQYSLPSPYIASLGTRNTVSAPLLVTNDGYRYLPRIMPTVCEGSMIPYHDRRKIFLQGIAIEMAPHIRLYFADFGWGVRQDILNSFPYVQFQDSIRIPIAQSFADTCLLILDHYSTSVHRALATNTPVLIFTPANGFSSEAEEVIAQLRGVGVWHDTPEGAAKFYASLVGNNSGNWCAVAQGVNDWWMSRAVQLARKSFCRKFALTSSSWSEEWRKTFDLLVKEMS